MRDYISEKDRAFPGLILLLGLVNGALPCLATGVSFLAAFAWIFPGLGLCLCCAKPRIFARFALFSMLGFFSACWQLHLPAKHYEKFLPGSSSCGAEAELMITDTTCTGQLVEWMPNPKLVDARVLSFRFTDDEKFRKSEGKILLRLPVDSPRVQYGDTLRVQGAFVRSPPALFEGAFDFQRYLRSQGVERIFESASVEIISQPSLLSAAGLFRGILKMRDFLMARFSDGVTEISNKKMLGALVFGTRQGLDFETRQAFVRSGTVHVLTVSGFHVGLLAAIFLWMLRPLPFRARYLILPIIVLIYVLTTGMQPPAMRALLMISVWSLHRAFLWSPSSLNVIFVSAALIIAWNPFVMLDMGFQYSFTCVFFLLASWQGLRAWGEGLSERLKWIPPAALRFRTIVEHRVALNIFAAMASCVVAWLASYGITLFYQGLYVPMAVPANLLALPVAWCLFMLAAVKFFLLPFAFLSCWTGHLLEYLLEVLTAICGLFAGAHGEFAGKPSLWTIPFFYTSLLLLVSTRRNWVFNGAAAMLAAVLISWHLAPLSSPPSLGIFLGGRSQEPALVLCEAAAGRATIINVPSFEAARGILNFLSCRGIGTVDTVLISRGRRACYDGTKILLSTIPVGQIILPSDALRYPQGQELSIKAFEAGTALVAVKGIRRIWHLSQGGISASFGEGDFSMDLKSGGHSFSVKMLDNGLGEHKIIFCGDSGIKREFIMQNSNQLRFAELRLN
ncbi:MAG: hypothetical protein A2X49_01230 [Lentisphaerae bacterium GWF2_52_8]|nr:MAG: hypothetical protein A2X49_01230 [Lentisphaerae bacterium GWF2_52_8]